jgi:hypothetical protein
MTGNWRAWAACAGVAAVQAQAWTEGFEAGTKTAYAAEEVACDQGRWLLDDALLGSSVSDRCFGNQSVRLRTGRLEMAFDATNGVEAVSAYVATYGADGPSAVRVESSADGANTWFPVGEPVAVTSAVLTRIAVSVHASGTVRLRFSKEGSARVNIDNVSLSDFGCGPVPPLLSPVAAQSVRAGATLSFGLDIQPTDGDPVTGTNVAASAGVAGAWGLTNGVFSYAPAAADVGDRSFTFTAEDKDGTSAPLAVAVRVRQPQNAAVRLDSARGRYCQSFDALAASGSANEWDNAAEPLPAWYAFANASEAVAYRTGTGSGTAGGLYAFGAEASSNRSLGSLAGGGVTYRYGLAFTNATGLTITNLSVRFTALQWRAASASTNTLAFDYCVTNGVPLLCQGVWTAVPALSFDSPLVTNLEQAAGAVCASETRCSALAEPVAPGQVIVLRWRDPDDAGSDHAFGIDDLEVAWSSQHPRGGTVLSVR